MSNCRRCARPIDDEYFPSGGKTTFSPFDTLAVIDSAHNPVEQEIFNRTVRPEGTTVDAFEKRSLDDTDFKGRPAFALDSGELFPTNEEPVRTRVLLTATYWGQYEQRRNLPLILQRFGVAIYRHATIAGEPLKWHLHTSPEWTHSSWKKETNAWLIAREYPFEGYLAERGHWKNVDRVHPWSCSSFTIEEEYQTDLRQVIRDSWKEWTQTCQSDPETLVKCVEDYMMFSDQLFDYRKKTGMPVPPKQNPWQNTTPIAKKVSTSRTLTTENKQHVKHCDPPFDMLQKKPVNFAHPSLARQLTDQSAAPAKKDTLGSTPLGGVANDSVNSKPQSVAAAAASSSGRVPPVTAQITTKPEAAELVGTTSPSPPVPPQPKATYAQMLKARATSGEPAQGPARQMMPA